MPSLCCRRSLLGVAPPRRRYRVGWPADGVTAGGARRRRARAGVRCEWPLRSGCPAAAGRRRRARDRHADRVGWPVARPPRAGGSGCAARADSGGRRRRARLRGAGRRYSAGAAIEGAAGRARARLVRSEPRCGAALRRAALARSEAGRRLVRSSREGGPGASRYRRGGPDALLADGSRAGAAGCALRARSVRPGAGAGGRSEPRAGERRAGSGGGRSC